MFIVLRLLLLLCLLLPGSAVQAHEVRPASMDISEQQDGSFEFRWRQPILGEYTISLTPHLSSGWLESEADQRIITDTGLIRLWHIQPGDTPLAGQTLSISGLERTITDVLVSIHYQDGTRQSHLIKAARPQWQIPEQGQRGTAVPEYLWLGLTHIWGGPDHLLYVLALMLLISSTRSLLVTISAFTVAHSLTLAAAALDLVHLRSAPVEAVISLSIVYVAVELRHLQQGRASVAQHRPWLIAFLFGLLHGFGFAGALQDIGLPPDAVAPALLLFNIGIECGQLLFVFCLLALYWLARRTLSAHQLLAARARLLAPYAIGSLASFWLLQRLLLL